MFCGDNGRRGIRLLFCLRGFCGVLGLLGSVLSSCERVFGRLQRHFRQLDLAVGRGFRDRRSGLRSGCGVLPSGHGVLSSLRLLVDLGDGGLVTRDDRLSLIDRILGRPSLQLVQLAQFLFVGQLCERGLGPRCLERLVVGRELRQGVALLDCLGPPAR